MENKAGEMGLMAACRLLAHPPAQNLIN